MSILNNIDDTFLRGDAYALANKMYDQIARFLQNCNNFDKFYSIVIQQKSVLKLCLSFYNISPQDNWIYLVTTYYLFNEIFKALPVKKSNERRLKNLFILNDEEFYVVSSTYFIKHLNGNFEYYIPNEMFINELTDVLITKQIFS